MTFSNPFKGTPIPSQRSPSSEKDQSPKKGKHRSVKSLKNVSLSSPAGDLSRAVASRLDRACIGSTCLEEARYLVAAFDPGLLNSGLVIVTNTCHILDALHVRLPAKQEKQRRIMGTTVTDELDRRLGVLYRIYYDALRRVHLEYGLPVSLAVVEGISRGYKGRQPDSRSTQAAGVIKAVAFSLGRPVYSASVTEVRQVLGLTGKQPKEARFEAAASRFKHLACFDAYDWSKSEHTQDALCLAAVGLSRLEKLEDFFGRQKRQEEGS